MNVTNVVFVLLHLCRKVDGAEGGGGSFFSLETKINLILFIASFFRSPDMFFINYRLSILQFNVLGIFGPRDLDEW